MHESDDRAHPSTHPDSFNLLLSLKQKKKQLLGCEKMIKQKIKQYYSDLTLMLHDKEAAALEEFDKKLCNVFENIDNLCAITETDRYQNRVQIFQILAYKINVADENRLKDAIKDCILSVRFQDDEIERSTGFEHIKTSKKRQEMNHYIIKQAYLEEISYLEQKIEKLVLKQDKIKARLAEMQSRQKMKKVGNTYLPYEEKMTSSLQVQRLESENRILINQIAESSQKILELRSENSMLAKQSQLLPTEKKRMCESINIIEQSIELNHYQEKISELESQIEQLRSQVQNERNSAMEREEKIHLNNQKVIEQYQQKIRQLTDYKERLENQCDSLQSKKMELQTRLAQLQAKNAELSASFDMKLKENQNLKEMNSNYSKLLQIKDDKITEAQVSVKQLQAKLKQSQDCYKSAYVQNAQKIQIKQNALKAKQSEIQTLKSVLKKEQNEKSELRDKMTNIEEQLFNTDEKIKSLENEIVKANKEKQSYAKKEVIKAKKQCKKAYQDEKATLLEEFKSKYGQFMQWLDLLKKEYNQNLEKSQKKTKLHESRMDLFKDKVSFQTKEMLEKLSKPGQKQKLFSVIESYIENEASLTMKNAQIKMLKEEVGSLKKKQIKKQASKPTTELEVVASLQQFEKKIFTQKLELQKQIYEARILQQVQQHKLYTQQKQSIIQSLNYKIFAQDKNIKQLKSELSTASSATNPEIIELKKINDSMSERQSKMQGQINGLKNNIMKVTSELQQVRQELKLKKDVITGLKKQLKDKELQKTKLNETLTSLMEESQKLKRTTKQATKKQAIFTEFKQKLISQTQLSEQICQLRNNLEEKQKNYRVELNKKDQTIKQLKINEEIMNKKLKNVNNLEEELFDLKQKIKKFKIEIDRKDTLIEHLKEKQEKASNQLTLINQNTQNQLKRIKKQLESEKSRTELLKGRLGKTQTNYQLLKLSLIRVYEQVSQLSGIQKEYHTTTTKADGTNMRSRYEFTNQKSPQIDVNKYRQALSILEISSEDLEMTNSIKATKPKLVSQYNSPSLNKMQTNNNITNVSQESIKLSKLLDSEDIDSKAIVEIFTYALES